MSQSCNLHLWNIISRARSVTRFEGYTVLPPTDLERIAFGGLTLSVCYRVIFLVT